MNPAADVWSKVLELMQPEMTSTTIKTWFDDATAVALEKTMCSIITHENFGRYFQERPAKIMSIMQYMSKRMRVLTRGYLEASQALEEYADAERLLQERKDWYEEHKDLYHRIMGLFGFD